MSESRINLMWKSYILLGYARTCKNFTDVLGYDRSHVISLLDGLIDSRLGHGYIVLQY